MSESLPSESMSVRMMRRRLSALRSVGPDAFFVRLEAFWDWLHHNRQFEEPLAYLSTARSDDNLIRDAVWLVERNPALDGSPPEVEFDHQPDRLKTLYHSNRIAIEAGSSFAARHLVANLMDLAQVGDLARLYCEFILEPLVLFIEEAHAHLSQLEPAISQFGDRYSLAGMKKRSATPGRQLQRDLSSFLSEQGIYLAASNENGAPPVPGIPCGLATPIDVIWTDRSGDQIFVEQASDGDVLKRFVLGLNTGADEWSGALAEYSEPVSFLEVELEEEETKPATSRSRAATLDKSSAVRTTDAPYRSSKKGEENDDKPELDSTESSEAEGDDNRASNEELWAAATSGSSLEAIAKKFDLSPDDVRERLIAEKVERGDYFNSGLISVFREAIEQISDESSWTESEKRLLLEGRSVGLSLRALSYHLGRRPSEIEGKCVEEDETAGGGETTDDADQDGDERSSDDSSSNGSSSGYSDDGKTSSGSASDEQPTKSDEDGTGGDSAARNHGAPWTEEREEKLYNMATSGFRLNEVKTILGRSDDAIRLKLLELKCRDGCPLTDELCGFFRSFLRQDLEYGGWSEHEDAVLKAGVDEGKPPEVLKSYIGRPEDQIRSRIRELSPEQSLEETSSDSGGGEVSSEEIELRWSEEEESQLFEMALADKGLAELKDSFGGPSETLRLKLLQLKCREGRYLEDDLTGLFREFVGEKDHDSKWHAEESIVLKVGLDEGKSVFDLQGHIGRPASDIRQLAEESGHVVEGNEGDVERDSDEDDTSNAHESDETESEEETEGKLSNVGEPWSDSDKRLLYKAASGGVSHRKLELQFQRHIESIRKKLIEEKIRRGEYFDKSLCAFFQTAADREIATKKWKRAERELLAGGVVEDIPGEELVRHLGRTHRDIYTQAEDLPSKVSNLSDWLGENYPSRNSTSAHESAADDSDSDRQDYDPSKSLRQLIFEILSDADEPIGREDVIDRLPEKLSFSPNSVSAYLSSEDYAVRVGRNEYLHRLEYPLKVSEQKRVVDCCVDELLSKHEVLSCDDLLYSLDQRGWVDLASHDHADKLLWGLLNRDDRATAGPYRLVGVGFEKPSQVVEAAVYEATRETAPAVAASIQKEVFGSFGFEPSTQIISSKLGNLSEDGRVIRLFGNLYYPSKCDDESLRQLFESRSEVVFRHARGTNLEQLDDRQLWLVAHALRHHGERRLARRYARELQSRNSSRLDDELSALITDRSASLSEISDGLLDDLV